MPSSTAAPVSQNLIEGLSRSGPGVAEVICEEPLGGRMLAVRHRLA